MSSVIDAYICFEYMCTYFQWEMCLFVCHSEVHIHFIIYIDQFKIDSASCLELCIFE